MFIRHHDFCTFSPSSLYYYTLILKVWFFSWHCRMELKERKRKANKSVGVVFVYGLWHLLGALSKEKSLKSVKLWFCAWSVERVWSTHTHTQYFFYQLKSIGLLSVTMRISWVYQTNTQSRARNLRNDVDLVLHCWWTTMTSLFIERI